MRKNGPKLLRIGETMKGKVSENPVNMVSQASNKHGSSFKNLFQSLNEKNIPYFICQTLHQQWELLVQNMLCDFRSRSQSLFTG